MLRGFIEFIGRETLEPNSTVLLTIELSKFKINHFPSSRTIVSGIISKIAVDYK